MSSEKSTSIITQKFEVPKGTRAVTVFKKNKELPGFIMIGNGMNGGLKDKMSYLNTRDTVKELLELTPIEKFAFKVLYDKFKPEYDCDLDMYIVSTLLNVKTGSLSNSDRVRFSKGFSGLVKKDIAKRIKREHYQLNPYMFIPTMFHKELSMWNKHK
jgi:hypothetical protein